jgi:hypothetical protein
MSKFDYINAAKHLSEQLSQCGYKEDAESIEMALEEGSTGNEICMMLRFYIKNILDQKKISDPMKSKLTELYTEVDSILQNIS